MAVRSSVAALILFGASHALADSPVPVPEPAWQAVITSQIEAFRTGDAPGAFSYAGAPFQDSFSSANSFFVMTIASGYAPIMDSQSHSFGPYERTRDDGIVQVVKFLGAKHELYEAVYELNMEDGAWRVEGVIIGNPVGIGV
jgi:hypothetical protein